MKKLKLLQVFACFTLLFFSGSAFPYFCSGSGGNGYINEGDPQATVKTSCGAPTTIQNVTNQNTQLETVQYWVYNNNIAPMDGRQPSLQPRGFTPTQTVFEVAEDKVSQISVNGGEVSSTNQCPIGSTIRVGDPVSKLMTGCGSPSATNTTQRHVESQNQQTQVWTYNYGPYNPQLILEFDMTGRLLTIKEGPVGY